MKTIKARIEITETENGIEGEWFVGCCDNAQWAAIEFIQAATGCKTVELFDESGHAAGDECSEGTFCTTGA